MEFKNKSILLKAITEERITDLLPRVVTTRKNHLQKHSLMVNVLLWESITGKEYDERLTEIFAKDKLERLKYKNIA